MTHGGVPAPVKRNFRSAFISRETRTAAPLTMSTAKPFIYYVEAAAAAGASGRLGAKSAIQNGIGICRVPPLFPSAIPLPPGRAGAASAKIFKGFHVNNYAHSARLFWL